MVVKTEKIIEEDKRMQLLTMRLAKRWRLNALLRKQDLEQFGEIINLRKTLRDGFSRLCAAELAQTRVQCMFVKRLIYLD